MKRTVRSWKKIILCVLGVLVMSVIALLILRPSRQGKDTDITVFFFNVGQGDATLFCTPDGNILIDAGTNAVETDILEALKQAGVQSLSYAVFTHAHEDHIGGADAVLSSLNAEHVILPEISDADARTYVYKRLLSHVKDTSELITVNDKVSYSIGELEMILYPASPDAEEAEGNEAGLVIRIVYKDVSFMIMGDAELEQENALISQYGLTGELCSTVLRVGHHGSNTSTSDALLDAVSPEYAVISVGAGNSYGHPTTRVLSRLEACGARILRTDTDGTVIIRSDGTSVFLENDSR